jgi:lipopolysaccharide/colanic/teichoic acid biosynthesis glycosyltransferase
MMRIFDILFSILILIVFSPLMLLISILIFGLNGRPIIYKQIRVGHMGREFLILKFRTMSNRILRDPKKRLSLLGIILRKTSTDELPQFFNVLNKDMSIVGPRPLPRNIEKKIPKSIKIQRRKILPGITGMSQINYSGKKRNLKEKIQLDLIPTTVLKGMMTWRPCLRCSPHLKIKRETIPL